MMDATMILNELHDLGITVQASGQKVQLRPGSKVPASLLAEVRQHKDEIINELRRPPETEDELRQLIDHLADPENFAKWLDWAMTYQDPSESPL